MRRHVLFGAVAISVFMSTLDATIVAVAFPSMISHFGTSLVMAGWVLTVYTLVSIAAIPIASRLSDSGRRKSTFNVCLVLFTSGSLLCSVAPNIFWLVVFRIIQGIGAGGFMSAATGIISDQLPDRRLQLVGLLVSIGNAGSIVGPNVGGVMVAYLGWQSVFWVNVPIGIATMVVGSYLIKADTARESHVKLDFLGIALLICFVTSLMVSVTLLGHGISPILTVLAIAVGLLFLGGFLYRCKTSPAAVISPELLSRRPFLAANLFNFVNGTVSQNGIMSLVPLYATSVYGMSTIESGLILTPRSIGIVVASVIASIFIVKWGYRRPIIIGSLGVAFGSAFLALQPGAVRLGGVGLSPLALVTLISLLVGIGAGIVSPSANNACLELMPEKAASITGIRQVFRRTGGVLAISVSTLLLQSSGSLSRGFFFVFGGFGLLLLLSLPAVFAMPERAD